MFIFLAYLHVNNHFPCRQETVLVHIFFFAHPMLEFTKTVSMKVLVQGC